MNIIIHAEVEGEESVQAYEGTDVNSALSFMEGLGEVRDLQCSLSSEVNGEARTMARRAKGEMIAPLTADINSWLIEHLPENDDSRETMTIAPGDVARVDVKDLLG